MVLLVLWGCGGDKETDDTGGGELGCSQLVANPLPTVPASEFPPDLGARMETYDSLPGRWTADTDCGIGEIGIKLVGVPRDELQVVEQGYPAGSPCGCTADPSYGHDGEFGLIATFSSFEIYIETWDDPGVQGRTLVSVGGLFDAASPFELRACGRDEIDPYLGSQWDTVTGALRVVAGELEASILLSNDTGESTTCNLSNFTLVEAL